MAEGIGHEFMAGHSMNVGTNERGPMMTDAEAVAFNDGWKKGEAYGRKEALKGLASYVDDIEEIAQIAYKALTPEQHDAFHNSQLAGTDRKQLADWLRLRARGEAR